MDVQVADTFAISARNSSAFHCWVLHIYESVQLGMLCSFSEGCMATHSLPWKLLVDLLSESICDVLSGFASQPTYGLGSLNYFYLNALNILSQRSLTITQLGECSIHWDMSLAHTEYGRVKAQET